MPKQVGSQNSKSLSRKEGYFWVVRQTLSYSFLCLLVKKYLGNFTPAFGYATAAVAERLRDALSVEVMSATA